MVTYYDSKRQYVVALITIGSNVILLVLVVKRYVACAKTKEEIQNFFLLLCLPIRRHSSQANKLQVRKIIDKQNWTRSFEGITLLQDRLSKGLLLVRGRK